MGKRRNRRTSGRRCRQDVICLPPPPDLPTTPPRSMARSASDADTSAMPLTSQAEPLVTAAPNNRHERRAAQREQRSADPTLAAVEALARAAEGGPARSSDHGQQATERTEQALPWDSPLPRNRSLARTDLSVGEKLKSWVISLFQRKQQPKPIGTDDVSIRQLVGLREDLAALQKTLDRVISSKPG